MVELLPSLLLNLASGPQIAVMKTATHMAVIASDAHISGMSRSDRQRGRSPTLCEGSCDRVDIVFASFFSIFTCGRFGVIGVRPDPDSETERARVPGTTAGASGSDSSVSHTTRRTMSAYASVGRRG